jgi:hypothetical protein
MKINKGYVEKRKIKSLLDSLEAKYDLLPKDFYNTLGFLNFLKVKLGISEYDYESYLIEYITTDSNFHVIL